MVSLADGEEFEHRTAIRLGHELLHRASLSA
jgi:hypothetical protein